MVFQYLPASIFSPGSRPGSQSRRIVSALYWMVYTFETILQTITDASSAPTALSDRRQPHAIQKIGFRISLSELQEKFVILNFRFTATQ